MYGFTVQDTSCIDSCIVFGVIAVEHKCPGEHVYAECGSACPLTCQNKDDQILCIELCKGTVYIMYA